MNCAISPSLESRLSINKALWEPQSPSTKRLRSTSILSQRPLKIFAKLIGKKLFVKLDMSEAYTQLVLDESSHLLATVNTPLGLMAVIRFPYESICCAIFQRTLEELLYPVSQASV